MNSRSVRLSKATLDLFENAKDMKPVVGRVASNLNYIEYLEDGTTKMAARPVIEPHLPEYQGIVRDEILEGMKQYPNDPQKAAEAGVSIATIAIARQMSDRTAKPAGPYFTGRAKGSWTAYLPGGRKAVTIGTQITAEQQRATLKLRRKANKKKG